MLDKLTSITQRFSPDVQKILSNTSWLLSDRILQMGLGLFIGILVARYLGPVQFGTYNYVLSLVGMFSPIVNMGLNTIVVRDMACEPSRKNETLGTTFGLHIIGALLTLLASIILVYVLDPNDKLTHWLVGIIAAATMFQAFDTIDFWFQSQISSKYVVFSKQTAYVVVCAIRFVLVQIQAPLTAFAWARFAELALCAVGMAIVYISQKQYFSAWNFNWQRAKELLKESFPLIISGLAIYAYSKTDQIMLGSLLSDKSQLGFYSVAVKLAEIFDFLPVIVASSLLPKLSQVKASGDDYTEKMQIYFDIMLLLWVIIAVPICLCSYWIVTLLYGAYYAPAASILSIYVFGQFSSNLGVARSSFLTIENKLHYSLYFSIAGAALNIALNLYLIPKYQAVGATFATLITYFAVTVIPNYIISDLKPVGAWILQSLNLYNAALRILRLCR
ncbi:flippase [Calothrix sp. 336/3]|uniref:flippase n=1 Tax=Calothrix sp. 336/3 TaxID=1337936 RepID=UPI0004E2DA2C|nr:flippase [Calothrix sp. 336/3]AKG21137.1 flippase [Calothrix sp. 336/3]